MRSIDRPSPEICPEMVGAPNGHQCAVGEADEVADEVADEGEKWRM
jgi:hypothetical protein